MKALIQLIWIIPLVCLHAEAVSFENVALNKQANQTITYNDDANADASKAVDGLLPTQTGSRKNCAVPAGDRGRWWVDLGGMFEIHSVKMVFRPGGFYFRNSYFSILMRNDVSNHDGEVLCGHVGDIGTDENVIVTCSSPIVARVVEYIQDENAPKLDGIATLCEVEVMTPIYKDVGDCDDPSDPLAGCSTHGVGQDRFCTGDIFYTYFECGAEDIKCKMPCFEHPTRDARCETELASDPLCSLKSVSNCEFTCGVHEFVAQYECTTNGAKETIDCPDYCCCALCPDHPDPNHRPMPQYKTCTERQGALNAQACP